MNKQRFFANFVAVAAVAMANAQTVVAELGFEQGDLKYTTEKAYTPGGTFGDWVNRNENDMWSEKSTEAHSGEYCMMMQNSTALEGNTWDRGFKMGNLKLEDNTAYRVSFWVKAEPGYFNAEGELKSTQLKTSLAIGQEYFDKPISTASGVNYYYRYESGMTGEWKRFSFVTFFTNKADQDAFSAGYSGKTDINGNLVSQEGDPFPEEYFLTINMFNPGTYLLDDIKIEKGVAFNEASCVADVVKLDFGYPTNIAALAKANGGNLSVPVACAKVTVNGEEKKVSCIDGKEDGFLYVFLMDCEIQEGDEVKVSFAPAANCPIIYTTDQRPSADVESEMQVLGFANESAYYDEAIDVLPSLMEPPVLIGSDPENGSFNLDAATFNQITLFFNQQITLDGAYVGLMKGGKEEDLTDNSVVGEDGASVVVSLSGLTDGMYTLSVYDLMNIYEVYSEVSQSVTFEVGKASSEGTVDTLYVMDLAKWNADKLPVGWSGRGDNNSDRVGSTTEKFSGAPRIMGGVSDPNHGIYVCQRGGSEPGLLSFGLAALQAKESGEPMAEDKAVDPVYFEAGKYRITYKMASWDTASGNKYNFGVYNDLGESVYEVTDIVPTVTVKNAASRDEVPTMEHEFEVEEAGYYYVQFSTTAGWGGFLLTSFNIIAQPASNAVFYNVLLAAAIAEAEAVLEKTAEAYYDGETKTSLINAIEECRNATYTSPSQYNAAMDNLAKLASNLNMRYININNYQDAIAELGSSLSRLDSRYAATVSVAKAQGVYDMYASAEPKIFSDDELSAASAEIDLARQIVNNIKGVVNTLTYRGRVACSTADMFELYDNPDVEALYEAVDDDDALVEKVNGIIKEQLYTVLATGNLNIPYYMSEFVMFDDEYVVAPGDTKYSHASDEEPVTKGINLTSFIVNPGLYTYVTTPNAPVDNETFKGWEINQPEGNVKINNGYATESQLVADVRINGYAGDCEYDFYQTIENLPVGVYDVYFGTRTGTNNWNHEDGTTTLEFFNDYSDATLVWDKYIYAQVDGQDPLMAPFAAGAMGTHPTVIKNVAVGEGQTLTIGVVEHYASGKAVKNGNQTTAWDTNTYADDARLYFVKGLEGYNYAEALTDIDSISHVQPSTPVGVYSINGVKRSSVQKGINIIRFANGKVSKIVM